jgi:hypothetical protein
MERSRLQRKHNTSPSTRMSTILGGIIMSSTNLASLDSATFWEKKQDQLYYILHITRAGKKDRKTS